MPRARQRIVFCDCLDCTEQTVGVLGLSASPANEAAAKQDPPPKCFLLVGTGFVRSTADSPPGTYNTTLDTAACPHFDRVCQEGSVGLLSCRKVGPGQECRQTKPLGELLQLLGVYEVDASQHTNTGNQHNELSLPARFKGLQGTFSSNTSAAAGIASNLGMAVSTDLQMLLAPASLQAEQGRGAQQTPPQMEGGQTSLAWTEQSSRPLPNESAAETTAHAAAAQAGISNLASTQQAGLQLQASDRIAAQVLHELGMAAKQEEPSSGGSDIDLLLMHLDFDQLAADHGLAPHAAGDDQLWDLACQGIEWMDQVVRHLLQSPAVRDTLLLTLVLTPDGVPVGQPPILQPGGTLWPPTAAAPPASHPPGEDTASTTEAARPQQQPGGSLLPPPAPPPAPHLPGHDAASTTAAARPQQAAMPSPAGAPGVWDGFAVPRPLQSFQRLGSSALDVDLSAPALCIRRLPGVVRRDGAQRATYGECRALGGQGAMLIDRLLHELAYKLGRAPKYGA